MTEKRLTDIYTAKGSRPETDSELKFGRYDGEEQEEEKPQLTPISGVVACHACPFRYYLEKNRERGEEPAEYTIAKQISYHTGDEIIEDEILEELETVNPDLTEEDRVNLRDWVSACRKENWQRPADYDVKLKSEKFGIYGRADHIFDKSPYIGIVRTAPAPEAGVYGAERIRAAAFTFCAEETLDLKCREVLIEYIPSGISRICKIQPKDRRETLRAIKKAKEIDGGKIPKKPKDAPCERCYLKDECPDMPKSITDIL
jgi:CRISPR-associated exonuclease Cas4